jgi:hypothetical protein
MSYVVRPMASYQVMIEPDVQNSLTELHQASFAWAVVCRRDRELAEAVLQSVYVKLPDGRGRGAGDGRAGRDSPTIRHSWNTPV